MVYTAVSAASPQKHSGREVEMRRCRQHQECDNVFILYDHFVERCKDKIVEEGYHDCLKRIGKIYHYILEHYLIERL